MSDEQTRLSGAQGGDGAVAAARQERDSRIAADVAQMASGACPGHDEHTTHHQGLPTAETQMYTHGQPAPRTPDTGGHQSASDRIG